MKNESPSPPLSPTVKPRRVLPEHEGRYKITLPSGTTPRSKQILAKKSMRKLKFVINFPRIFFFQFKNFLLVQSDKIALKTSIFNRLGSEDTDKESSQPQVVKFSTILKSPQSSVFNRLGDKSSDELSSEDSINYNGSPKTVNRFL